MEKAVAMKRTKDDARSRIEVRFKRKLSAEGLYRSAIGGKSSDDGIIERRLRKIRSGGKI
jgi:hypothetical protein